MSVVKKFTKKISLRPTEQWKIVDEFPEYEVSDYARIRHIETKVPLKQCTPFSKEGFWIVYFPDGSRKRERCVNHLVATHFVPNPNNWKFIQFVDGSRGNNDALNLMWRPLPKKRI
ncbi:MAG: NUMOD4 domain-containing protein [Candidatus Babeliales bacterium]|nr:NUMOD4 domain-containing protein [Candidatus Babeliales bacterium]